MNGFCFDSAVHLSFASDIISRDFFNQTPYQTHLPISFNYYHGLWIKHPILNNMYSLSVDEKVKCIKSFVERECPKEIVNYGQWLRACYGNEITEKFYDIYTKKYWTVEPEKLSISWVGKRLNSPDMEKILLGAFTKDTGMDYYVKEMRYPIGGKGYETFLKPLQKGINIIYNKCCEKVDFEKKYVMFHDGTKCYYDNLISSIPLPELIKCSANVPDTIKKSASKLKASRVSIVSMGFRKPNIAKCLWFYIYDEDIMAARVNSPSKKCKENAPKGCSSLQFEIYHGMDEIINKNEIISNTKYALKKMKLCEEEDILFMDYRLIPYGNVIFEREMENDRDAVKGWLDRYNVKLIGRFGEWDYLWSDQSYLSGYKVGNDNKI